jgi:hypothetical protein
MSPGELKDWKEKRHIIRRRSFVKTHFNLSHKQLNDMYAEQSNKCAICKKGGLLLGVDHCHTTGKVRGLLCMVCNRGIGMFKDDIILLKSAIKYLEKNM